MSPRRSELLAATGVDFSVCRPDFPEGQPLRGETVQDYALRMASGKAESATLQQSGGPPETRAAIIACDTIVCLDGLCLGKPSSLETSLELLKQLNGRLHEVLTAVVIIWPDGQKSTLVESTEVQFMRWPVSVLEAYVKACRPLDKAGAYGIQDAGGFLVRGIRGSWTNVVGMPLAQLLELLLDKGVIAPESPSFLPAF